MTQQIGWLRYYPKLNTRITIPFLLMILVVAGIGVFTVTRLVAGNLQERLATQLADSAQAAANSIVDIERTQLAALRAMAFTQGVAQALVERDTASLEQLLLPTVVNQTVDDLIVFDQGGNVVYRLLNGQAAPLESTADFASWNSVQQVMRGESDLLGDKFVDIHTPEDEATFYFAAPVVDGTGQRVGGMLVGIQSQDFVRRVGEQTLSTVTLFDRAGQVLNTTFRQAAIPQLHLAPETASGLLEQVEDDSPLSEQIIIERTPYRFLYAPFQLRSSQIGLIGVALPVEFVQDRIGTSRNIFLLLFAVVVFLVASLGLMISRSIVRPVFRIVETTRAVRSGDLSRRVNLATPDELGELGQSVDRMTNQLVTQNQEIQSLYVAQVEETARRDAVFASINDGVFVLDRQGRPILLNDTAREIVRSIRSSPTYRSAYGSLLSNPERLLDPQMLNLDDAYFSALSTPVSLTSGELLGYVIVFRNITEIIKAEKLKDDIILQLSHELRTPLAAARGYTELLTMLANERLNAQEKGFSENALEHLDLLGELVNQVIDVNTMLAGRMEISFRPFDLSRKLQEVVEESQGRIQRAQLRVSLSMPDEAVWIEGDEHRLKQVFQIVLKNAYSYTLPDGWIEVQLEADGSDHVVVTIADSGVGIGADEIDKVFDKLYRGRSADAGPTDARGMGLGLYIARELVQAHHGTISLASTEMVGTTVTVRLPSVQPSQPNLHDTQGRSQLLPLGTNAPSG
ncbi:MAG: cache domain-containing protein [bacterium]|nr:cache domain-containing protein [bacterium]